MGLGERFESREDERARERASGNRTFIVGGRGRRHRRRGDGSVIIVFSFLFLQRTARDSVRRRGILLCCSVDLEEVVASCPFPFPFFFPLCRFTVLQSGHDPLLPITVCLYVFSVSLFLSWKNNKSEKIVNSNHHGAFVKLFVSVEEVR